MTSVSTPSFTTPTPTPTPTLKTHFELVGEFHDAFGHPQRKEPYTNYFEKEPELLPFRVKLINEETDEFRDAYKDENLIEMADALADLSYVINGAGQCLGLNMDKLAEENSADIRTPIDLKKIDMNVCKNKSAMINNYIKALYQDIERIHNYNNSLVGKDVHRIGQYLLEMLVTTYDLGHRLGFNMDSIFREVHRSNMTKVCLTIEDAESSVKYYKDEGRYENPSFKAKDNYFVVYDAATSKILKNHKWDTPKIELL